MIKSITTEKKMMIDKNKHEQRLLLAAHGKISGILKLDDKPKKASIVIVEAFSAVKAENKKMEDEINKGKKWEDKTYLYQNIPHIVSTALLAEICSEDIGMYHPYSLPSQFIVVFANAIKLMEAVSSIDYVMDCIQDNGSTSNYMDDALKALKRKRD